MIALSPPLDHRAASALAGARKAAEVLRLERAGRRNIPAGSGSPSPLRSAACSRVSTPSATTSRFRLRLMAMMAETISAPRASAGQVLDERPVDLQPVDGQPPAGRRTTSTWCRSRRWSGGSPFSFSRFSFSRSLGDVLDQHALRQLELEALRGETRSPPATDSIRETKSARRSWCAEMLIPMRTGRQSLVAASACPARRPSA